MAAAGQIVVSVKIQIEWVHMCPPADEIFMPCCGRTPFEVPIWNRMTSDPLLVSCPGARHAEAGVLR